jgi:hypothetical protein
LVDKFYVDIALDMEHSTINEVISQINNDELEQFVKDELGTNLMISTADVEDIDADAQHFTVNKSLYEPDVEIMDLPPLPSSEDEINIFPGVEIIDDLEVEHAVPEKVNTHTEFQKEHGISSEYTISKSGPSGFGNSEFQKEQSSRSSDSKIPIVIERVKRQPPATILEAERKYNEMLEKQKAAMRPKQSNKKPGREVKVSDNKRKLTQRRTTKPKIENDVEISPKEKPAPLMKAPSEILDEPRNSELQHHLAGKPNEIEARQNELQPTDVLKHLPENETGSDIEPQESVGSVELQESQEFSEHHEPTESHEPPKSPRVSMEKHSVEKRIIIERERHSQRSAIGSKSKQPEEEKRDTKVISTTTRSTNVVGKKSQKNSSVTTTHHVLDRSSNVKKSRIPNAIYKHMEQDIKKKTIQNAKNLDDLRRITALQDIIPEMGIDVERATLMELRKLKAKQQHERRNKEATTKPEPSERTQKIESILNDTKLSNFQKMVALRNSSLSTRHAAGVPIKTTKSVE